MEAHQHGAGAKAKNAIAQVHDLCRRHRLRLAEEQLEPFIDAVMISDAKLR